MAVIVKPVGVGEMGIDDARFFRQKAVQIRGKMLNGPVQVFGDRFRGIISPN